MGGTKSPGLHCSVTCRKLKLFAEQWPRTVASSPRESARSSFEGQTSLENDMYTSLSSFEEDVARANARSVAACVGARASPYSRTEHRSVAMPGKGRPHTEALLRRAVTSRSRSNHSHMEQLVALLLMSTSPLPHEQSLRFGGA